MIPILNRKNLHQLSVPQLSGGINFRDGLNLVRDNQLTDCLNMWFHNGILKTRPGIRSAPIDENDIHSNSIKVKTNSFNTVTIDGKTYTLEAHFYKWERDSGQDYQPHYICFKLCAKDDSIYAGKIYIDSPYITKINVLPVVYKGDIYVYLRHFEDEFCTYMNEIYKIAKVGERQYGAPEYIPSYKMYAPLVLTNCSSCYKNSGTAQAMLSKGAQQAEGFNLLGSRYRMVFSTFDNTATGYKFYPNGETENPLDYFSFMEYSLPYTTKETSGTITVEYIDKSGVTHNHSVFVPYSSPTVESEKGTDGYYLHAYIKGSVVHFTFNYSSEANDYEPTMINIDEYVHNNMTVTAPCKNTDENWEKVTGMTQAIWYGNTSLGVSGGSRLFLGGNINDSQKALVVWSDFENPLYFSENNYAYIGDKSQKVTAFGRQGSSFIVFKEKEMYSGEYSFSSVTANDIIEQSAIDITANTANFSFILIHSLIGCDCPQSIQLCLNRLVWATTEGKIYTLTDRNQYSERNVLSVSLMIENRLPQEDLKNCYSSDWHGFYLLFCKDQVYAMNYNSYGYMNISAYTQNYDANLLIPWFCWQLPKAAESVYSYDDDMIMVFLKENGGEHTICRGYFDFLLAEDQVFSKTPIKSMVQTKIYDFGYFERLKKINRVSILFGSNDDAPVLIECITESGVTDTHLLTVKGRMQEDQISAHLSKQLIPAIKLCQIYGMRFICQGRLQIKGINISFKLAENVM